MPNAKSAAWLPILLATAIPGQTVLTVERFGSGVQGVMGAGGDFSRLVEKDRNAKSFEDLRG
jgi:hypothetical protein